MPPSGTNRSSTPARSVPSWSSSSPTWGDDPRGGQEKAGAIRGARNGRILLRKGEIEREVDDPLTRAHALASSLGARLDAEMRLSAEQRLPVAVAGLFPYLARSEAGRSSLHLVVDLDRCLFRDDLESGLTVLAGFQRHSCASWAAP